MTTTAETLDATEFTPLAPPLPAKHAARRSFDPGRVAVALMVVAVIIGGGLAGAQWLAFDQAHIVARSARFAGPVAELGARFDGRVAEILVQPGDRVAAGDAVARLESSHLEAGLARAVAARAEAAARLAAETRAIAHARARLSARLAEAREAVVAADASRAVAEAEAVWRALELESYVQAHGSHAATDTEVDRARTADRVARAAHDAANAEVGVVRARVRTLEAELEGLAARDVGLAALAAGVQAAQAAIARAEADVAAATVIAPRDGVVLARLVEAGTSVRVGNPILALWHDDELWVDAWIDASQLDGVPDGGAAVVRLTTGDRPFVEGRVDGVHPVAPAAWDRLEVPAEARSRFGRADPVLVRIRFDTPPPTAFPGLRATVSVPRSR